MLHATITVNGTIGPPYINFNHNSENTAQTTIYSGAEYTGGLTVRTFVVHGNTSPLSSLSGSYIDLNYKTLVTKTNNESYIIEVENIDENSDTAYNLLLSSVLSEHDTGLIT